MEVPDLEAGIAAAGHELEQAGLHVDRVVGASIGSVVATLHAAGMDAEEIEERLYAEFVRRNPFADWRFPSRSLAKGARVRAALQWWLSCDPSMGGIVMVARR